MCFSNNEIELQTHLISEKIRKHSIYKPIRMECIGGKSIELQNPTFVNNLSEENLPAVSKVILEDKEGMRYDIEPNEIGLRYATGEITYKEYKQVQNKESKLFIGYLIA